MYFNVKATNLHKVLKVLSVHHDESDNASKGLKTRL